MPPVGDRPLQHHGVVGAHLAVRGARVAKFFQTRGAGRYPWEEAPPYPGSGAGVRDRPLPGQVVQGAAADGGGHHSERARRHHHRTARQVWPLTPKFDRATRLFLKFDMRHGAYRHATGLLKI